MTEHEALQELVAAYAIDAVEPDDVAVVTRHLAECPRCRAELADLREVAAALSNSGSDAPVGVWDKIAGSLDDAPPPLRLHVERPVVPRWRQPATLAAAAALLVVALLGTTVLRLRSDVNDLRHSMATSQVAAAATSALSSPDARVARLSGTSGETATAVVRADGQGYLLASSFPSLQGRIYQLWGSNGSGRVTSLGTIPGPGVYAFAADPSVTVVMVTVEQAPAAAPTGAPIVSGTLA
jgi:Anti-sigma-K factor rskA/Putative zinc-finger